MFSIAVAPTPALAGCVDNGDNDFTITDGGANLDADCAGATAGAAATINGAISGAVVDAAGAPNGWNYVVTNGASVTSAARTIDSTGPGASLDNAGTITSTSPPISFAESEGVVFHAGGTVNNQASGRIEGQIFAVRFGLVGAGRGMLTNAGVISNAGVAGGFDAVRLDVGGQVDNLAGGQITGAATGVRSQSGSLVLNNWGTIDGATFAVYGGTVGGHVINNRSGGVVTGATSYGVWVQGTGTITNEEGGRIEGVGEGIWLDGSGSVINSGTIIGSDGPLANYDEIAAVYIDEGSLTNTATGTLTGHNYGVYFERGAGTVTNAGTITGTGITGAYFGAGGTLDNSAGGTIIGGVNGVVFAGAAGAVTNAGIITGSGGTGIQFASGNFDDVLELHAGSQINGTVLADGGTDTLRFGGTGTDSFDLGLIDEGAGTQQYRGFETFEVNGGTWHFSGSAAQTLTANGGTVAGTGTLGGLVLNAGATLAPGNSIGTLVVDGNLQFADGSTYQVDINAAGGSDVTAVSGTTMISTTGTALNVIGLPGSYPLAETYIILTATGGVTGSFATVTDNLPDIDLEATYNPYSVQLSYVKAAPPPPPPPPPVEPPVEPVEPPVEPVEPPVEPVEPPVEPPAPPPEPPVPPTSPVEPPALPETSSLSPKQIHPSTQAAVIDTALNFSTMLRMRGALYVGNTGLSERTADLSLGYLPKQDQSGAAAASSSAVWGSVIAGTSRADASGTLPGWDSTAAGLAMGFERRFDGLPVIAGLVAGYSHTDVDSQDARAGVESWHVGAYAAAELGALTLSGATSFAWHDYDIDRMIALNNGGSVLAEGQADGYSMTASGEAFYDVANHLALGQTASGSFRFGPIATIDAIHNSRNAFVETGAGVLNLSVDSQNASQVVTGLGVGFGASHAVGSRHVHLDARIGWEHVFGDRSIASVAALPVANAAFSDQSAATSADRLAIGAGAAVEFSERVSGHIRYEGAFSGSTQDHYGSAGFAVKF